MNGVDLFGLLANAFDIACALLTCWRWLSPNVRSQALQKSLQEFEGLLVEVLEDHVRIDPTFMEGTWQRYF
jgi:hypothetical protein